MIINPFVFAAGGGGSDPYFSNVQLLAHFDGSNGDQGPWSDSSSAGRSIVGSASSATALSTGVKQFGTASLGFAGGSSSWAYVADHASLEMGSGDWTWEMSVYAGLAAAEILLDKRTSPGGTGYSPLIVVLNTNGSIRILGSYTGSAFDFDSTTAATGLVSASTWAQIAFSRNSSNLRVFVDGSLELTVNVGANPFYDNGNPWVLGASNSSGGNGFAGNMDEVRYTVGVGRYTAGYTPAAAAFPDS